MKTTQLCPLEHVGCCQGVAEYHPAVEANRVGELHPGDILDDRFLITEVISRSGMAMIFKAQDLFNHNADVALKVPHLEFESDAGFYARFRREEEIGLTLDHPYVVKFIPVHGQKSRPYLVTEYLRGCTLAHLLKAMSPLPEKDALKIASLLCEALQYLHDHGVIHRDLKPHNVMVGCDGSIRLLDFGLAKSNEFRRVTFGAWSPAMGTPDYMAPEQVQCKRGDERTDIYSLGAMLYEMLTGVTPFDGDNSLAAMNARVLGDPEPLRKLNPNLSIQAEEIVLHAMERNPKARYSSVAAMQAELDNLAQVKVTGRCDQLQEVAPWKRMVRQYAGVVLALTTPVVVPIIVCVWLLIRHDNLHLH
jgi:eukaryotic-like serine/threonine-protein kinase